MADLVEDAKFCSYCGAQIKPKGTEDTKNKSSYAERRHLTVLFSDLAGSTQLSDKLDPEDMREILSDYQSACTSIIKRYGGYVAKFLGDGVLAYFGYPDAHEDDARRSVSAGIGIVEAMRTYSEKYQKQFGVKTDVRIGIHTGLVVVGDMGGSEDLESHAIVGKTPNLAARIQSLAELNTVYISQATHKLLEGFFQCSDLKLHELKGISEPIRLYQAIQKRTAKSRLEAKSAGLTPFTGRKDEMQSLKLIWNKAKEGTGSVALVDGEAGVGKSRILRSMIEIAASEETSWMTQVHCSQYYMNSSFYPIIEMVERIELNIAPEEKPKERLKKIEDWAAQYNFDETAVQLMASLLSIPLSEDHAPLKLTPVKQKERTIDLLISMLIQRALKQPALFVVEDLHWADPSTLELLDKLIDRIVDGRIMCVFSHRPEFSHNWHVRKNVSTLDLTRLPRSASEEIILKATNGKKIPDEAMEYILRKTDGIPLFLEELTKMMVESEMLREKDDALELSAPLDTLPIPDTLHESLAARLDRLKDAKPVAQLGATIGREFSYSMIDSIPGRHRKDLSSNLAKLVDAGLLDQKNSVSEGQYVFRHALIQDSAYSSLLKSSRRELHKSIAESFEANRPDVMDAQPELIAYHYTEAISPVKAMSYWQKAGELAVQRSAMPEAISHLAKAVDQSAELPEGAERLGGELMAQTHLGLANMQAWGYAHPDVEKAFTRARDLCSIMGDPPQIFPILHGLVKFRLVRGEYVVGLELSRQLQTTAEETGDQDLLIEALYVVGAAQFWMGDPDASLPTLARLISNYDPITHAGHAMIYGEDPYVVACSHNCWQRAIVGEFNASLVDLEAAEKRVKELDHPWTTDYMFVCKTRMFAVRRDIDQTEQSAIAFRESSIEHGFPWWVAAASLYVGWCMAHRGEVKKGLEMATSNLAMWRILGAEMAVPGFLLRIAEIHLLDDNPNDALITLDEALIVTKNTSAGIYDAEIHRTKGLALSILDRKEEGLVEMNKAIKIATKRNQRLWLIRAAVSHVQLSQKLGLEPAMLQTLKQSYAWFKDDHDLAELIAANQLTADNKTKI